METKSTIDVDVTVQGSLPGAADYARRKIGGLAAFTHQPAAHARVRLTNLSHSRLPGPVVAQANLEISIPPGPTALHRGGPRHRGRIGPTFGMTHPVGLQEQR